MIDKKIGIIGCGNMGEAIFSRLARTMEKSTSLMVSEADSARRLSIQEKHRIIVEIDNNRLVKFADVIILAVKPHDLENVLSQEVCCGVSADKLVISIAAGVTTRHIEKAIGSDVPVIRAMPNMPAVIGEAISSLSAGRSANAGHMDMARSIFSLIGEVVVVDENLVDAVTAISGSGPAYFFYLIEALAQAAEKLGLGRDTAERLAVKTAIGSAKMLEAAKEKPSVLRARVTSKGGTTEAALRVFEAGGFKALVCEAAEAAFRKYKDMHGR